MGRQIGVAMTMEDEVEFLDFLRKSAEVQLLQSSADDIGSIYIDAFPKRKITEKSSTTIIWNNEFGVEPVIAQDKTGRYYVFNQSTGPALEYISHIFAHKLNPHSAGVPGRIFWGRYPDPTNENYSKGEHYSYDLKEFERWYNKIVRWIKKNGTDRKDRGYYYMPNTSRWYK